jgi:hypothetical protein
MSTQTTRGAGGASRTAGPATGTLLGWLVALVAALALTVVVLAVQVSSLREQVDLLPRDVSADTSTTDDTLKDVCTLLGNVAGAQAVHRAFAGRQDLGECEQAATQAAAAQAALGNGS